MKCPVILSVYSLFHEGEGVLRGKEREGGFLSLVLKYKKKSSFSKELNGKKMGVYHKSLQM